LPLLGGPFLTLPFGKLLDVLVTVGETFFEGIGVEFFKFDPGSFPAFALCDFKASARELCCFVLVGVFPETGGLLKSFHWRHPS
jgi:hypothetical protein